jgi:hypothetical protein
MIEPNVVTHPLSDLLNVILVEGYGYASVVIDFRFFDIFREARLGLLDNRFFS